MLLLGKYLIGTITHRYYNTGITFTGGIHFCINCAYIQILIFRYDIKFVFYSRIEEIEEQDEIQDFQPESILPEIISDFKQQGIIDLEFYKTTPEHAKEYGIESKNPLFIKNIFVNENERFKSIGNSIIDYIEQYAKENSHDVIFGNIPNNASFIRKIEKVSDIDYSLTDNALIKMWLRRREYNLLENNFFYKTI